MSGPADIDALIAEADALRRRGGDARPLWDRIAAAAPGHPRVLFRNGRMELEARRPQAAIALFAQAASLRPDEAAIPFHEALACRALADVAGEMSALDRALTADPDYLPALLGKAALLARQGQARRAVQVYKRSLERARRVQTLLPGMRDALDEAERAVAEDQRAMEDFLRERVAGLPASERAAECLAILAGRGRVHVQHAELLHFPQLPPIPFYPREYFPWLAALEAATEAIRDEFLALAQADGGFVPYVDLPRNEPLGQWEDLNGAPQWSAYYLWKDGTRLDEHCRKAPATTAALAALPQLEIDGFAPTAFFSLLAPGTHLPAHAGSTNIRLTAHLPLVVPGPARFRVGNFERPWREGQAWVFDDTIEHEAWNDAASARCILIFDVWNPLLSPDERAVAAALLQARRDYYGGQG
jgi:aspartyl/asparaginyl beta-hydroxylase (cupin superfamily)